jgi:putative membrane protein
MMSWGYGASGWMMVVALVVGLLLIALTVALGYALYGGGSADRDGASDDAARSTAAERVLEMRFARGEIDADELEQAKQALRH